MQGYIFDYGGTLDTGGCHWGKMFWHAYQRAGVPVTEQQFREAYVFAERTLGSQPIIKPDFTFRQTIEAKLRLQLQHLEMSVESGEFATAIHLGEGTAAANSILPTLLSILISQVERHTAHSREVLSLLPQPKVLVSNFYGNMPTVLREFGLDTLFLTVIESATVGIRKPDPQIFRLGVEALGLQPGEVTVVGDSIDKDIVPARQVGCQTVWLRGEPWHDGPVDTTLPDRIISDLDELNIIPTEE